MRNNSKKSLVHLALFLLLVLAAAGAPRMIAWPSAGGAGEASVPAAGGSLAAMAVRDTGTAAFSMLFEQTGKAYGGLCEERSEIPEKNEAPRLICDANGNILNPYHGSYQSMVYQVFVPEKGFG